MKKLSQQKGFTLVELAIVMTIIGLLIGGILKGQELMNNARVTATVAQLKAFEAAVTTFRDAYNAIPGDMLNAQLRLQNCGAYCNPNAATAGNNMVGAPPTGQTTATTNWTVQDVTLTAAPAAVSEETWLFWTHLLKANLIGGVIDHQGTGPVGFGISHPAAAVGGGYYVFQAGGGPVLGQGVTAAGTGPSGLVVGIVDSVNSAANVVSGTAAGQQQAIQPAHAAQIDRKMDDGSPATGFVVGAGIAAQAAGGANTSCVVTPTAPATAFTYREAQGGRSCGLVIRIQG